MRLICRLAQLPLVTTRPANMAHESKRRGDASPLRLLVQRDKITKKATIAHKLDNVDRRSLVMPSSTLFSALAASVDYNSQAINDDDRNGEHRNTQTRLSSQLQVPTCR